MEEVYRRSIPVIGETVLLTEVKTGSIAASGSEVFEVQPPDSYMYKPISIHFYTTAPSGATTGTHYFIAYNNISGLEMGISQFATYTNPLKHMYNDPTYQATSYNPSDKTAWLEALRGMLIKDTEKFSIAYVNATDAAQTGDRTYKVLMEKIPL